MARSMPAKIMKKTAFFHQSQMYQASTHLCKGLFFIESHFWSGGKCRIIPLFCRNTYLGSNNLLVLSQLSEMEGKWEALIMDSLIEFFFNTNKYRKMKMALTFIYILILFIVNVNRAATANQMYLFFLCTLILLLVYMLLKIFCYNRKKNVTTGKKDWIEVSFIVVLFVIIFGRYIQL